METLKADETVRSLPDAYLRSALETRAEKRSVQFLPPEVKDLLYFPVVVNDRQVHRIGVSQFSKELEDKTLLEPDTGARYRVTVDGVDPIQVPGVELLPIQMPDALSGEWEEFLKTRRRFFRSIRSQGIHGLIEVADLDSTVVGHGRSYAKAYLNLLRAVMEPLSPKEANDEDRDLIRLVCQIDTLSIQYKGLSGSVDATVILPTHPLRVYWYISYAELLRHFESQIYSHPPKQRRNLLSLANIERLRPHNFPAFIPALNGSLHVHASDVSFFTGVALPVDAPDPVAHVQEVSRLLGYDVDAVGSDIDARRIAREIGSYFDIHSYADAMRLNIINPGAGTLVRDVVLSLFRDNGQDTDKARLRSVDILTHSDPAAIQRPAPGLDELVATAYQNTAPQSWSHLHPMIQVARRPVDQLEALPGHDTHVAICIDHFKPSIATCTTEPYEESASVYGLAARFQSRFDSSDYESLWCRKIAYGQPPQIERHPVNSQFTTELLTLHQTFLQLTASLAEGAGSAGILPSLRLDVDPEATRLLTLLHDRSDWVITVDRHFGVEYYDDPSNVNTARNAERYLLDYAPEFMEGMGHRMIVTTGWRDEVADVLTRGLEEMALASDAGSCRLVLDALKAVSGRLALRLVRDTPQEKEAISLAILVEYLRHKGELADAFLIPIDAHPEFLDPGDSSTEEGAQLRCDLLMVKPGSRALRLSFVEVKYRSGELGIGAEGALLDRIADQTRRTEEAFRSAFGCTDDEPVDQAIRRSHLANVMKFYLERARRHGLVDDEAFQRMRTVIQKIEVELPRLDIRRVGYVVCPMSQPRPKVTHQGAAIHFITAVDISEGAGIASTGVDLSSTPPIEESHKELVAVDTTRRSEPRKTANGKNPDSSAESIAVVLGETIGSGEPCLWGPSTKGSPHLFVVGIPGQGKSVTTRRIVQATVGKGLPTLALDFHGELAAKAAEILNPDQFQVIDATAGLPFSPFEAVGDKTKAALYWQANALSIAEIVAWVCDLGDIQRDLIYEAIRNCYRSSFIDADEPRLPTPDEVFAEAQRLEQTRKVRNVIARIRPLFDVDFELFRPEREKSLYDMISGLAVIDLHNLGQETLQLASGAFLLRKIYKDMLQWTATGELRLLLVLDEAHRLAKDLTLPKIMKEGRKFGVVIAGASQGLADFHPDVLGNAGTKVVFRMNFPESRRVAGIVRGNSPETDVARKIEGLSVGRAIVSTPEWRQPVECAMLEAESVSQATEKRKTTRAPKKS